VVRYAARDHIIEVCSPPLRFIRTSKRALSKTFNREQTRMCPRRDASTLAPESAMAEPFMAGLIGADKIKEHCDGANSLKQGREALIETPVENAQIYAFRRMGNVWGSMLDIRA
jgi:hypothetical protein